MIDFVDSANNQILLLDDYEHLPRVGESILFLDRNDEFEHCKVISVTHFLAKGDGEGWPRVVVAPVNIKTP